MQHFTICCLLSGKVKFYSQVYSAFRGDGINGQALTIDGGAVL